MTRVTNPAGSDLSRDIVHAWRRLRATPIFTIFAITSLAIGVGVTTAVFSVVQSLLWQPSGIPNDEHVVMLVTSDAHAGSQRGVGAIASKPDFDQIASDATTLDGVAAALKFYQGLSGPSGVDTVSGEAVTGKFFDVLALQPAIGRTLADGDDDAQRAVAVLSHRLWRTKWRSDPAAVGSTVRLGGIPFEIVGVAPEGFSGLSIGSRPASLWVPLTSAALLPTSSGSRPTQAPSRASRNLTVVGHLASGRSAQQASAELSALSVQLDGGDKRTKRRWQAVTVAELHAAFFEAPFRAGLLIVILVGMVLLVACTNLANLTLARGRARRHELSVRAALGASRWRLVREQCVESAIIGILGAVGAFSVARVLMYVVTGEIPVTQMQTFDLAPVFSREALAFAVAAVGLSLAVFGLGPALQLSRGNVRADLANGSSVGDVHTPAQRRSIRWQVAITCGFFLIATMSMKAVIIQAGRDPGIDLDRLSVAFVNFRIQGWDEERSRRAIGAMLDQARAQPEIESAALSSGMPFGTTTTPFMYVTAAGATPAPATDPPNALTLVATPGIFRTLGVPVLKGRAFDERDSAAAPAVIVLNQKAAREVFGSTDIVGREVSVRMFGMSTHTAQRTATVVGIAGDSDTQFFGSRTSGTAYVPLAQQYEPALVLVGRARGDARKGADALRAAVRAADSELAINTAGPASTLLTGAYRTARMAAWIAGSLGLLALILSMAGLHGVLVQMVALRTREVGLRMALGAESRQIARMVIGEGFRPILQGLAIGLFLGILGRFVVRATLAPDVSIIDPVALLVIPVPVCLAGLLACYLPARRAALVDPNIALRAL